jgi:hypothetical protein
MKVMTRKFCLLLIICTILLSWSMPVRAAGTAQVSGVSCSGLTVSGTSDKAFAYVSIYNEVTGAALFGGQTSVGGGTFSLPIVFYTSVDDNTRVIVYVSDGTTDMDRNIIVSVTVIPVCPTTPTSTPTQPLEAPTATFTATTENTPETEFDHEPGGSFVVSSISCSSATISGESRRAYVSIDVMNVDIPGMWMIGHAGDLAANGPFSVTIPYSAPVPDGTHILVVALDRNENPYDWSNIGQYTFTVHCTDGGSVASATPETTTGSSSAPTATYKPRLPRRTIMPATAIPTRTNTRQPAIPTNTRQPETPTATPTLSPTVQPTATSTRRTYVTYEAMFEDTFSTMIKLMFSMVKDAK